MFVVHLCIQYTIGRSSQYITCVEFIEVTNANPYQNYPLQVDSTFFSRNTRPFDAYAQIR